VNISTTLNAQALLAAAADPTPQAPLCALSGAPYVLIDLGSAALAPDAPCRTSLTAWLQRQAAPVVGLSAAGERHPLAGACDTVVADATAAAELLDNIEAAPLAALVLVQLLRMSCELSLPRALLAESLAYATLQGGAEFRRWLAGAQRPAPGAPEAGAPLLLERRAATLDLCLNRPARRNALSVEMRDALIEALELVVADSSIEAVRVRGAGKCFSAGGDLGEFGSIADTALAHAIRCARSVPALLACCAQRVSFHLHGAVVGAGLELAAFGTHIVADAGAFFQLPEIRYGLIPGSGGCVSIPRRIGRWRTAYLALSGRRLSAAEALEWGLIDAISAVPLAAVV
jgi:enoyl-CoA hydratase